MILEFNIEVKFNLNMKFKFKFNSSKSESSQLRVTIFTALEILTRNFNLKFKFKFKLKFHGPSGTDSHGRVCSAFKLALPVPLALPAECHPGHAVTILVVWHSLAA